MSDVKLRPLTPEMLSVLGSIEEHWHRYSGFPSVETIKKKFPKFDINSALKHETFRLALNNRGIEAPANLDSPAAMHGLTQEQVAAITTIINFDDPRPRHVKLRELGIPSAKWQGWLKNAAFKKFLHELSSSRFTDAVYVAHEGLTKAMDRGDTNAIKFYLEATGRYTQQSTSNQNIRVILARVIESIQCHIKDPEVLRAIAADFELIMKGDVPPVEQMKELENF